MAKAPWSLTLNDRACSGLIFQRSYMAPDSQSSSFTKQAKVELTPCPIYEFAPWLATLRDLT